MLNDLRRGLKKHSRLFACVLLPKCLDIAILCTDV
jgi:hypothetical protein